MQPTEPWLSSRTMHGLPAINFLNCHSAIALFCLSSTEETMASPLVALPAAALANSAKTSGGCDITAYCLISPSTGCHISIPKD